MTAFHTEVPPHPYDIILANPTQRTLSVSILAAADLEGYVALDGSSWFAPSRTATQTLKAGEPSRFELTGLCPDTSYTYRFWSRSAGASEFAPGSAGNFHTPRPPGSVFKFTIIADSHLDSNMRPAVYERALANALAGQPDFHIDLGDTFMTDKRGKDFASALPQYVAQRYYLGQLCRSAPLFMVLGNHDGEWGYAKGRGDAEAMAPWSFAERTRRFPPPLISGHAGDAEAGKPMYTGCTSCTNGQGANYYEFTWGDAHCIVLDPFWFTTEKMRGPGGRGAQPADDADTTLSDQGWNMTLGKAQYDWLASTLEASHSRYEFVFVHHLVGGLGRPSRGGIAAAKYFEWGGSNADGTDGFATHRPGWSMPIHALLVKHHVSAVFHGHDHLYAHEELDGVHYQCVPQPGNVNAGTRSAAEYGYRSGTILASPGHVQVSVGPETARVEFIRAALGEPPSGSDSGNRSIADSYEIPGTSAPQLR